MSSIDRATAFTLDYLSLLEERLHFRVEEQGLFIVPSEVNIFTMQRLSNDLKGLLNGRTAQDALSDSRHYGQNNIQTVGFGLIDDPDFERFAKMGFFLGTRLVLWDFIGTRILHDVGSDPPSTELLGLVASNLLHLKPIAEKGGLTILPHPLDWSDSAKYQVGQLAAYGTPRSLSN